MVGLPGQPWSAPPLALLSRLRHLRVMALVAALAAPAGAETVLADCASLTAALLAFHGYDVTAPPSGQRDGWCVLDRASLRATDPAMPDLVADRLRLRGASDGKALVGIEVDIAGLRLSFKPGDGAVDDRLRGMVRLQTVDLRFAVAVDGSGRAVELRDGHIRLSGGTEMRFSASFQASNLSLPALLSGGLTAAEMDWRNDGRFLRPLMEVMGEQLVDGARGTAAVDAARLALRQVTDNLPENTLAKDARAELEDALAALPQGRGRLVLSVRSDEAIGAARLLLAELKEDPLGPVALAELLDDVTIGVTWTPGIAP